MKSKIAHALVTTVGVAFAALLAIASFLVTAAVVVIVVAAAVWIARQVF